MDKARNGHPKINGKLLAVLLPGNFSRVKISFPEYENNYYLIL